MVCTMLFRSSRAVLPLSRPDDIPKGNAGDHDVANAITVVTESFMTAARRLAD